MWAFEIATLMSGKEIFIYKLLLTAEYALKKLKQQKVVTWSKVEFGYLQSTFSSIHNHLH